MFCFIKRVLTRPHGLPRFARNDPSVTLRVNPSTGAEPALFTVSKVEPFTVNRFRVNPYLIWGCTEVWFDKLTMSGMFVQDRVGEGEDEPLTPVSPSRGEKIGHEITSPPDSSLRSRMTRISRLLRRLAPRNDSSSIFLLFYAFARWTNSRMRPLAFPLSI